MNYYQILNNLYNKFAALLVECRDEILRYAETECYQIGVRCNEKHRTIIKTFSSFRQLDEYMEANKKNILSYEIIGVEKINVQHQN